MSRKRGKGDDFVPGITAAFEGPDVLSALLERAGSPQRAEDVVALFTRAIAAKEPRSAVIPTLFTDEPRFASPDDARRLYGNLFGLWDRLASGRGALDDAPEVLPEPALPQPLPERGAVVGEVIPVDVVEVVWKHLAATSPREVQRRRDRFANGQPDLAAWLDTVPLPESGALAVQDLTFEAWLMFDQAFGERLGTVEYRELRALEKEPPTLEATQPALATYVSEQLDILADEDPAFGAEPRAQVERTLASVVSALTDAVHQPS